MELCKDWVAFTKGDATTLKVYGHMFPNLEPASVKFVTFQQVVLRDRMATITEDESLQVEEYIKTHFQEETELHDSPWQMMKVDETQTDVDLEKQYVSR